MSQRRRSTDAVEPEVAEPSGRRTPLIWLYELATILPLFVYLGYEIRTHPGEFLDGRFAGPLLLEWVVAIAVVDLLPIPTSIGFPFSLSFPLQLSVALIYPTPVAGAIALLGASDWREFRREIPAMQGLWNRSQLAWSVVFESLLFERLASLRPPSPWWQLGPAVLVAAIVGYSVNALLCAVYFHLRTGEGTFAILRDMHVGVFGEFVVSYMGLALFAVIVATTFLRIGPWSIAVFIAPLAFARQMFTRTQSLQVATNELAVKQRENEYQALHDALTDLPNRVLFQQKLRETIATRSESSGIVAVMLIDLDHFKEINDTLGHHAGDMVLCKVAERLDRLTAEHDLLARLGGDEFGLVLPDLDDEASAIRVAERILEELERPIAVEALQLDVSGSIGIALYPTHSEDVETLLRRADVAMYAAKESGSGYEVYTPSLDRNSPGRLTLITQVRPAIENHEFALFYQPKVRLADEKVEGVEALIRWRHPERGLVMPDDFIPMVERTVLLKPLTLYAINEALRQSHHWERQGLPLDVAVNLSPRSLLDPQLPDLVAELLERWEVDPARLTLELTESFLMADSGRSIGVMGRLSSVGIQLSIDDFGTGYSSLSHLKRLPLREIKVDKSFVEHMREDPNDAMIVAATVELGRNLGLRVVAEGVEDRETLEELARMGCDMAQGFEFSEPLAATDLTRWVEERGGAAALAGGAPPST
ncbi:MAG: putative bifunctional diguanylate cyclase/phosphodiesterase, partial [Actinomycetota bacterium]